MSLRVGVYLATTVIMIGLALFFITGNSGYPPDIFPRTANEMLTGIMQVKPAAITGAGLFLLILTPVFRVAASVVSFLLERDYLYTMITLIVLAVLLFSLVFGKNL